MHTRSDACLKAGTVLPEGQQGGRPQGRLIWRPSNAAVSISPLSHGQWPLPEPIVLMPAGWLPGPATPHFLHLHQAGEDTTSRNFQKAREEHPPVSTPQTSLTLTPPSPEPRTHHHKTGAQSPKSWRVLHEPGLGLGGAAQRLLPTGAAGRGQASQQRGLARKTPERRWGPGRAGRGQGLLAAGERGCLPPQCPCPRHPPCSSRHAGLTLCSAEASAAPGHQVKDTESRPAPSPLPQLGRTQLLPSARRDREHRVFHTHAAS